MAERILVVNAGSSSLKLALIEDAEAVASTTIGDWAGAGHVEPIGAFLDEHGPAEVVGHRVVHGGPEATGPILLDAEAIERLRGLTELAPLHQPRALAGIDAVRALLPEVPAVAAFDTSFHRTLPAAARTYALPAVWNRQWRLQRFGFHGLSHAWAAGRAAAMTADAGRPVEGLRVISCHLGAGASLCAIAGGRSVDTTMGFTPLSGLVMATRSGSVDPGLLLWLQQTGRVGLAELSERLETGSGLRGLTGTSGDLRAVIAGAEAGDEACGLGLEVYLHGVARHAGAMAASLGGVDAVVFTGGVGENSPLVRAATAERLAFLGVDIDLSANQTAAPDADLTPAGHTGARVLAVASREDLQIAREVGAVLGR